MAPWVNVVSVFFSSAWDSAALARSVTHFLILFLSNPKIPSNTLMTLSIKSL